MNKITLILLLGFGMINFSIADCYGPEPFVDLDDNGFWTGNETYTDVNNNGEYDSSDVRQDCDVQLKIETITETATDSGIYDIVVHYKSSEPIGGYQMKFRSDGDVTPGVDGDDAVLVTGAAELTGTSGFLVQGTTTIIAFSFSGGTIPASDVIQNDEGQEVPGWSPLLSLTVEETGDVEQNASVVLTAINNGDSGLVFSDGEGVSLSAEFLDALWTVGSEITTLDNNMLNPYSYSLKNNYPNPFNPSTTIEYSIAEISDVNISVYDASGRLVKNLISSQHVPGDSYQVSWNGTNESGTSVSAGMYFYKINAGSFVETKKMLLIK
tara:strand:+ start:556 stop:1530 length:975 start_codon:yes stop_codon:yes gene_type:complete